MILGMVRRLLGHNMSQRLSERKRSWTQVVHMWSLQVDQKKVKGPRVALCWVVICPYIYMRYMCSRVEMIRSWSTRGAPRRFFDGTWVDCRCFVCLFVVLSCAGQKRWFGYDEIKVGDAGYCRGNVKKVLNRSYEMASSRCDEYLDED